MEQERDPAQTNEPSEEPPDKDLSFVPVMTEGDDANLPPDSEEDPDGERAH